MDMHDSSERRVQEAIRTRTQRDANKSTTRLFSDSTNEGKPILISHYVPRTFGRERQFFFLYSFPLTKQQQRAGQGGLLFVGPDCALECWLGTHEESFYETASFLPRAFRALVDSVEVPYSADGMVRLEKGRLLYRVGQHVSFLSNL